MPSSKRWTKEEFDILREDYQTYGINIPRLMRDRTLSAIQNKAQQLGLLPAKQYWTAEDIDFLIKEYPIYGADCPSLKHKTKNAIINRASEFGLSSPFRDRWSKQQGDLLREFYPTKGSDIPELLVKHTKLQIRQHARALGLTRIVIHVVQNEDGETVYIQGSAAKWSEHDIFVLKEQYPVVGSEIPDLLVKYSRASIIGRANRLGLKSPRNVWSENDIDLLMSEYPQVGTQIPVLLEKFTQAQIRGKAHNLGLLTGLNVRWTLEEDAIIKERYKSLPLTVMEQLLPGRSSFAISGRAKVLGVFKSTAASIARRTDILEDIRSAYIGTNGQEYVFVTCAICGARLLLSADNAMVFEHGGMCSRYRMPEFQAWRKGNDLLQSSNTP